MPTLNFAEVIVCDELSMWLKNKKILFLNGQGLKLHNRKHCTFMLILKNHCRRTVRVPTLNFAEVIVYDELSMWLKYKKINNSVFEWSRFKGEFVNFEPFIIVSLLSGLFAQCNAGGHI